MKPISPMLAHPKFKLGLLPPDPSRVKLKMHWKAGAPPDSRPKVDNFAGWDWDMHGNDRYGVCGPVSMSHHREMTTKILTGTEDETTQTEVYDLYRRSGNPDFNPGTGRGDRGVVMSVLMDAATRGGLGGAKLLGYAGLADLSDRSIHAAIDRFGGVLFAVSLQASQQDQTDRGLWDYSRSAPWGGHAIMAGSYDQATGRIDVATWAKRVGTTPAFRSRQLDEVWLPIWPELVNSGALFNAGIDLHQLARDFETITGKGFPVPIPDPPPPPVIGDRVIVDVGRRVVMLPHGWTCDTQVGNDQPADHTRPANTNGD